MKTNLKHNLKFNFKIFFHYKMNILLDKFVRCVIQISKTTKNIDT